MMECLFWRGTMLKRLSVMAVAVLASEVFAQNFPVKPIRFILPYPPGGNVEVLGRPIANEMSKSLGQPDRKSTRLNSSHSQISYAVFCLKKKNNARTEGATTQ